MASSKQKSHRAKFRNAVKKCRGKKLPAFRACVRAALK